MHLTSQQVLVPRLRCLLMNVKQNGSMELTSRDLHRKLPNIDIRWKQQSVDTSAVPGVIDPKPYDTLQIPR